MEQVILTREELYDLAWSLPLLTLSKKYAISDVGLRKICIKMEIPLPKAGHWQKLRFDKKINKPRLPSNYNGQQKVSLSLRTEEMQHIQASPSKILQKKIEEEMKSRLSVPEKLSNPDKLIIAARESLNKKDRYEHNGLISCNRDELGITVGRPNIPRALRFMDTLIKALKVRGHNIEIQNGKTNIIIDGQSIVVQLREKLKKEIVKGKYGDDTIYHPIGMLAFQITSYPGKEWKDGNSMIEALLSKIITKLELMAQEHKEEEIQRKKQHEIWQEKERIRKEYAKRKERDLADFKDTLLKAVRWHKAVNLRNYINEVEAKAKTEDGVNEELSLWLEWARQKADWYDPFIEKEDDLLNGIDRETLGPVREPYSFSW